MSKNNTLVKNTILLSIGTLITKGLLFVMVPFFSKWLSTEQYGKFDLICTYVSLLIPVIDLAIGEAIFRFSIKEDLINIKRYISNGLALVIFNLFICLIILFGVDFVCGISSIIPFVILLIGELLNNHLRSFLRAIKRLDIYSISSAISVIFIAILTSLFILKLNLGLNGIVLGYGLGYILGNAVIIAKTKYWNYIDMKLVDFKIVNKLISYSLPLVPNNIAWWIMNVSDRMILNLFIGPVANGIYAIANKVPALCSSVFSMFSISWQQSAVEHVDCKTRDKYFNSVYNNTIGVMISLCAGLLSINFILFDYIFDLRYNDAKMYVPILVTAILFSTLSQFFGGIQISFNQTRENGISTVIGAIINIVINLMFIKNIGVYAAAFSTLISYMTVSAIRYYRMKSIVRFKMNKFNILISIIYIYFLVSSYITQNLYFNVINLVLACILFTIINKNFMITIVNKVYKNKKN